MTDDGGRTADREPPGDQYDDAMRRKVVRSSVWVGLGYGIGQLLTFGSTLVLVRLLSPSDFGIVAVSVVLLAVVTQVQESGVGAALIHSRRDLSVTAPSALVFAASSGFVLTAVTIAIAPLYTHLVRMPEATPILQTLALVLAIRGLAVVPGSVIERSLKYRLRTVAELSGATAQAVVSIACAVAGLGAWSLVIGQLAGSATQASALWALTPWRPSPRNASRSVLAEMLRYGRFVSATNIVNLANRSIDTVVVGRVLGSTAAGVYAIAWRLSSMPNTFIGVIVGRVMFAVYARLQRDLAAVRTAYVENLQRTLLLALPVTAGLAIATEPIVDALLGDGWEGVVEPLRILAAYGLVRLITAPSGEVFKGMGKPHLSLFASVVFLVVGLGSLIVLVPRHGTSGAAFAMLIAVSLSGVVAMAITLNVLELTVAGLARDLARPFACALVVALTLAALVPATSGLAPWPALAILSCAGTVAFVASVAVIGRPLVAPVRAALRRT